MLAPQAATVRRVKKHYLQIVPLLQEMLDNDLPQRTIAKRLNESGYQTIARTPYTQPLVSRLIKRLRAAGQLSPDPFE